jgi:hypothetical protein
MAALVLLRQPKVPMNWLIFGCAIITLVGQGAVFTSTKWL